MMTLTANCHSDDDDDDDTLAAVAVAVVNVRTPTAVQPRAFCSYAHTVLIEVIATLNYLTP